MFQDVTDCGQRQGATLPGAAKHKAMVTFKRTLVGEQDMQAVEFHIMSLAQKCTCCN
jgi:hypothetical protein